MTAAKPIEPAICDRVWLNYMLFSLVCLGLGEGGRDSRAEGGRDEGWRGERGAEGGGGVMEGALSHNNSLNVPAICWCRQRWLWWPTQMPLNPRPHGLSGGGGRRKLGWEKIKKMVLASSYFLHFYKTKSFDIDP